MLSVSELYEHVLWNVKIERLCPYAYPQRDSSTH